MTKKAQITVFAILGVVVVLSTILFFTFKGNLQRKEIAPGVSMIVEELPSEFMPVKPFVEKCLEKTTEDGLIILGENGGYIYTDKLNPGLDATEGDSVRLSSDFIVPYWFYLASPNSCVGKCRYGSKKMPLKKNALADSFEAQLAKYIDDNLAACIDDFKSIKELGYDVEEGRANSDVIIAEDDVVVKLDYPITISKEKNKQELASFYISIPLDLKDIYDMAEYITNLEQKYRFIEKSTLNLLVAFSGKDSKKLPPMSDSDFGLTSKISWRKSVVRNKVRELLSTYTSVLQVVDTLNWQERDTGKLFGDKLYNYGMSIPNNISINDVEVSFDYLNFWDMYFDLNCNGEICKPESAFTDLLPIGMQRYNFAYDLSYPVLVEINDPYAFNGKGYSFNFMLESNLRNNRAMPALFEPLPSQAGQENLLCDENKRTSGEITINVKDSFDDNIIGGVDVIYTCIDSCYIGTIEEGIIKTALPVCFGGTLSFRKEGYETKYVSFDSYLEKKDVLNIGLNPIKQLSLDVKKKLLKKQGDEWTFSNVETDLVEGETAVVSITNGEGYDLFEVTKDSQEEISLAEGTFDIEVNVIDENGLYIPPEKKEYSGESVHLEAQNISNYISGSTSFSYTFTKEDIAEEKITFYVITADLGSLDKIKIDDLAITSKLDDYSKKHYNALLPRIG
jgi:hypothetical protein